MGLTELIADLDSKTRRLTELAEETRSVELAKVRLRRQIAALLGISGTVTGRTTVVRPNPNLYARVCAALTDTPQTPIQISARVGVRNDAAGSALRALAQKGRAVVVSRGLYVRPVL